MKRIAAILFLVIYLFTTTELSQLLKLPAFIEHFSEHKSENKSLTLFQFLCIHYAHGNVKDADYEKDMKLPFKTFDTNNFAFTAISVPSQFEFSVKKIIDFSISKEYFSTENNLTTAYLATIWQPPRFS